MEIEINNSFKLIAPFTMTIAGCTMSGKTQLVKNYVLNASRIIVPPPQKIVISYTEDQAVYNELQQQVPNVHLIKGLDFEVTDFDSETPSLLILDDQMRDIVKCSKIQELFTRGVH